MRWFNKTPEALTVGIDRIILDLNLKIQDLKTEMGVIKGEVSLLQERLQAFQGRFNKKVGLMTSESETEEPKDSNRGFNMNPFR